MSESAPLIGITKYSRLIAEVSKGIATGLGDETCDIFLRSYARNVTSAGGVPVEITRESDPVALVAHLNGLLLSGGSDVNPDHYGEEHDPHLGTVDDERDEFELTLVRAARKRGVPILGICRGCQVLNVGLGGSLNQHVDDSAGVQHAQYSRDAREGAHQITLEPGSTLSMLMGATEASVNSRHHQTLKNVAPGLVVSARASDGHIEGVELPGAPVLAVQWHPEAMGSSHPIFEWLVGQAREFASR